MTATETARFRRLLQFGGTAPETQQTEGDPPPYRGVVLGGQS